MQSLQCECRSRGTLALPASAHLRSASSRRLPSSRNSPSWSALHLAWRHTTCCNFSPSTRRICVPFQPSPWPGCMRRRRDLRGLRGPPTCRVRLYWIKGRLRRPPPRLRRDGRCAAACGRSRGRPPRQGGNDGNAHHVEPRDSAPIPHLSPPTRSPSIRPAGPGVKPSVVHGQGPCSRTGVHRVIRQARA